MWQQRAYFEQSNVLDVTIQCQFNMASKNVAEFSTLYSPVTTASAEHSHSSPTAFSSCARTQPGSNMLPSSNSVDNITPVKHSSEPGTGAMFYNGLTNFQVPSSKFGQCSSRNSMQFLELDQYSSCMNDSGYGSPNGSFHQQTSFSPASSEVVNSRPRETCETPGYTNAQSLGFGYVPPTGISQSSFERTSYNTEGSEWINMCARKEVSADSFDSTESSSEDMKLAMRERDLAQRLFTLRARDSDLANELESYYQSQTSMVDLERHKVLCQMAYDKSSSDSINVYYNRKLLSVLEFVENKLSKSDKCTKTKSAKRPVTSPKKSRLLPKHAVKILETWYQENLENPYPSREVTLSMASEGNVTVEQIRKWFANKRNRSRSNKMKACVTKD